MASELLPYPVTIATGALDRLDDIIRDVAPRHRVLAVTDITVARLYADRVTTAMKHLDFRGVVSYDIREATKTRETWSAITDQLLAKGLGRDTTLVALGGGVVGDVVGFVAATYMRGVPFVQVPTTLLAMVDASVGGKTGVDTSHGKNLVGAFHQPSAVVIDPSLLETLPGVHYRGGFAEIIKHGVIADAAYFASVRAFLGRQGKDGAQRLFELAPIIERSVQIKASVVARDERESGLRKVLNFGHTIAHAIEAATNYRVLHGEAVAMGMVAESRIAERIGVADRDIADEIAIVCEAAGLPTTPPALKIESLLEFTRADKKARGGRVEYALPRRIGEMAGDDNGWGVPVDDRIVREVLTS
ncbi:MAG: 3-dehydroquinate synthase [Gemmatimonadaceae bacterium]